MDSSWREARALITDVISRILNSAEQLNDDKIMETASQTYKLLNKKSTNIDGFLNTHIPYYLTGPMYRLMVEFKQKFMLCYEVCCKKGECHC